VQLLVNEQYVDSIMQVATIRFMFLLLNRCVSNAKVTVSNEK